MSAGSFYLTDQTCYTISIRKGYIYINDMDLVYVVKVRKSMRSGVLHAYNQHFSPQFYYKLHIKLQDKSTFSSVTYISWCSEGL